MIIRAVDAIAGFSLGAGVFLISTGLKQMPGSITGALGWVAIAWAVLIFLGSVAAAIGSLTRPHTYPGSEITKRNTVSLGLEWVGWLLIWGCALIYAGTTAMRFGLLDGAIAVGFAIALGALAFGKWWPIQSAITKARRNQREGKR